jgi:endo-beta-N-acetylglucosaminidase D
VIQVGTQTHAGIISAQWQAVLDENRRLRAALAFYADDTNWMLGDDLTLPPTADDRGDLAREALK